MEDLITPPHFPAGSVSAFFTTKKFVSGHEHISDAVSVRFEMPRKSIYLPIQKHTNRIHVLEQDEGPEVADAVITDRRQVFVGVLVADCVPVLIYDTFRKVIGAVHAGWRGTAEGIVRVTIMKMQERFNCSPADMLVAIGPSIRQCSYEVDADVKDAVSLATGDGSYHERRGDKYHLDLSTANRIQAAAEGVPVQNIWQSADCTFCSPERFYSYRFAPDTRGRQGGFIGMW